MSYDLAVFDADHVPEDRQSFLDWFEEETKWSRDIDFNDPANLSPCLSAFYFELIELHPPMNGPHACDDDPDEMADYCCSQDLLYIAFGWSSSKQAYDHVFRTAEKDQCGFFDVSSTQSTVWLPNGNQGLMRHSKNGMAKPWWKFW